MSNWVYGFVVIWVCSACILAQLEEDSDVIAKTEHGLIRGTTRVTPFGLVDEFLGIPFSAPPLGNLRFKRPVRPEPWDGIRNASEFGNACIQRHVKNLDKLVPGLADPFDFRAQVNEDCLYLNVWTPNPREEKAGVMVMIHGGGWVTGAGSIKALDGRIIAATERIVYVSMNYRLGSLGLTYIEHPDVDGNVALFDQLLAIQWVKDNIAEFGGDPGRVTLVGQSAGAFAAGMHIMSPLSRGLFRRVVMQSGGPLAELLLLPKATLQDVAIKMAENMGCPHGSSNLTGVLGCLRSLDAEELLANEPTIETSIISFSFFPVLDGKFLIKTAAEAFKDGDYGDVQAITGFTANEGTAFLLIYNPLVFNPFFKEPPIKKEDLTNGIHLMIPNATQSTLKKLDQWYFQDETSKSILSGGESIVGDYMFKCGVVRANNVMASTFNRVYSYYFTHRPVGFKGAEWLGVAHASDVIFQTGYVFNNNAINFNREDKILARRLMRYYANFVKTGDPNSPETYGSIKWPLYTNSEPRQIVLSPNNRTTLLHHKERDCAFWDSFGDLITRDKS